MQKRTLKVVFGLQNQNTARLRNEMKSMAAQKGYEFIAVSRFRKEGIFQYISENKDYDVVVLQEALQPSSPYTTEDLLKLVDQRNIKVIISVSANHYNGDYLRKLYSIGIYDAIFEEDAFALSILNLILCGRTRQEARKYYRLQSIGDIDYATEFIDSSRIDVYLNYISSGGPRSEISERYLFVAKQLKQVENIELISRFSKDLIEILKNNDSYLYYFEISHPERNPIKRLLERRRRKPVHKLEYSDKNVVQKTNSTKIHEYQDLIYNESSLSTEREISSFIDTKIDKNTFTGDEWIEELSDDTNITDELIEEDISDLMGLGETEIVKLAIGKSQDAEKRMEMHVKPDRSIDIESSNLEPPVLNEQEEEFFTHDSPHATQVTKSLDNKIIKSERFIIGVVGCVFAIMLIVIFICIFLVMKSRNVESSQPLFGEMEQQSTPEYKESEVYTNSNNEIEQTKAMETEETEEESEEEIEEENVYKTEQQIEELAPVEQTDSENKTQVNHKNQTSTGNTVMHDVPENTAPPSVEVAQESSEPESKNKPANPEVDYNGKIYTGTEVINIAKRESNKGVAIYVISRQHGEGYFNSGNINSVVDSTCSFLSQAKIKNNVLKELTFIQQ